MSQAEINTDQGFTCDFELHGCRYRILIDHTRPRLAPKFYVQRMRDFAITERYYSWADGAFSAVYWGRAKWV